MNVLFDQFDRVAENKHLEKLMWSKSKCRNRELRRSCIASSSVIVEIEPNANK